MKKLLSIIFSLSALFSCSKNNERETYIPLFHSTATEYIYEEKTFQLMQYLSGDDIDKKIENKESFALFVYFAGCGTCDNFNYVIRDYISNTKVIFQYTTWSRYNKIHNDYINLSNSGFVFYENGKAVSYIDDINTKVYNTNDFEKLISSYVYQTNVYIQNTVKVNLPLETGYNTFDLNYSCFIDENTIDPFKTTLTSTTISMLLINGDSYTPNKLYEYLKTDDISYLHYYSSDDTEEEIMQRLNVNSTPNTAFNYKNYKIEISNSTITTFEEMDI